MKKRAISLALIMSVLLCGVSCSESTQTNDNPDSAPTTIESGSQEGNTAESAEPESEILDDLPEGLDFGGRDIRFIVEEAGVGNLSVLSVYAEEDSGDLVPSVVFQRNLTIADRLNLNIKLVDSVGQGSLSNPVRNSVNADSDDYDIISAHQYDSIHLAPEGLLLNLSGLDYLDFDREYWASDFIQNMGYLDVLPWATGDAALRYTGGMYATFVNSEIWNNIYADTNIYDLVLEGEWTLDKMRELTENVYEDANGDGIRDEGDIYGFILSFEDPIEGMAAASMVQFSVNNEDNIPEISLANDRTYAFYDKMYALVVTNNGFYNTPRDDSRTTMKMFSEGHSLFTVNKVFNAEINLRDMETDFMLIPAPKLDTNQAEYNTRTHDSTSIYGIPITNSDTEATTAALEALASESYRTVTPAYYETALKVKYVRDSESGQMIDLIRKNVSSDFASMYSGSISGIVHTFRGSLESGKESIASTMQKASKLWTNALNVLIERIQDSAN